MWLTFIQWYSILQVRSAISLQDQRNLVIELIEEWGMVLIVKEEQ